MRHAVLETADTVVVRLNFVLPCVESARLGDVGKAHDGVRKDALPLLVQLALEVEVLSFGCLDLVYQPVDACVVVLFAPLQLVDFVLELRLPACVHVLLPPLHGAVLHVLLEAIGGLLHERSRKSDSLLMCLEGIEASLL